MNVYRKLRYIAARSGLREPLTWMQHRGLRKADVFLASFERSGSTWLRFVLAEILSGESSQFTNVNAIIPELFLHRQARAFLGEGGRVIKTHEPYRSEYHRAIYLVRDVRDVLLSNYVREKAMGLTAYISSDNSLDQYVHWFLSGKSVRYGSWQHHIDSWLNSPLAKRGDLLVVRYEDLRGNTETQLRAMLEFLEIEVTAAHIRKAIANNSIEKMRQKEDQITANRATSEKDVLLKFHRKGSEDARFVRSGSVAGWRGRLTDEQLEEIDRKAGDALLRCGYPLGCDGPSFAQEAAGMVTPATE